MTTPFYVFDLDGTLANLQHRVPLMDGTDQGYREFFAACSNDEPIHHVIFVLNCLAQFARVEIWSGRSDEVHLQTWNWLQDHGIDPGMLTRMRSAGDHRPDHVVKREMLKASIEGGFTPTAIFDDRDQVVAMWREEGIPCFQVAPGAF